MPYISDSRRIELALLPFLAQSVLVAGCSDPTEPGTVEAKKLFWDAHFEALAGVDDKKQKALARRVARTHDEVLAPYMEDETRASKFGLVVFYVLKTLTDCDYLVVPPESSMGRGLALLLPALQEESTIDAVDASARKQARKVIEKLNAIGLYRDALQAAEAAHG